MYKSFGTTIQLRNSLAKTNQIGGKKIFHNNNEIDYITTDAYVITPYLFVENENKILLLEEKDEGGIYGYIMYLFDENNLILKQSLNIAPVNDIELSQFIQFENVRDSIKINLLQDKFLNTKLDTVENSSERNFLFQINKNQSNSIKNKPKTESRRNIANHAYSPLFYYSAEKGKKSNQQNIHLRDFVVRVGVDKVINKNPSNSMKRPILIVYT